jgi:hypothetical protein
VKVLIDLTGRQFGSLTVLAYSHYIPGRTYWRCRCVCGNECHAVSQQLRNGKKLSCGCGGPPKLVPHQSPVYRDLATRPWQ